MTKEDIALIQTSFARVFPLKAQLSRRFLETLFNASPEIRPLYQGDVSRSFERAIDILALIVKSLGRGADIARPMDHVAFRPRSRMMKPGYFAIVGAALVEALEHTTPGGLSGEERAAWSNAYGAISGSVMETLEARSA